MNKKIAMLDDMIGSESYYKNDLYTIRGFLLGTVSADELYMINHETLYKVVNKILNCDYDAVKYLIEMPKDGDYSTTYNKAIFAATLLNAGNDRYSIKGPKKGFPNTICGKDFKIITGNIPEEGVKLHESDYLRIIANSPYLFGRMLSFKDISEKQFSRDLSARISRALQSEKENYKDTGFDHLKKDDIKTIEFSEDVEYISYNDIQKKEAHQKVKQYFI